METRKAPIGTWYSFTIPMQAVMDQRIPMEIQTDFVTVALQNGALRNGMALFGEYREGQGKAFFVVVPPGFEAQIGSFLQKYRAVKVTTPVMNNEFHALVWDEARTPKPSS